MDLLQNPVTNLHLIRLAILAFPFWQQYQHNCAAVKALSCYIVIDLQKMKLHSVFIS
jgi:hypothetical protein